MMVPLTLNELTGEEFTAKSSIKTSEIDVMARGQMAFSDLRVFNTRKPDPQEVLRDQWSGKETPI